LISSAVMETAVGLSGSDSITTAMTR